MRMKETEQFIRNEPSGKQAPSIPFQLQAYSQCFLLRLNHSSPEQVCFSCQDHDHLFSARSIKP